MRPMKIFTKPIFRDWRLLLGLWLLLAVLAGLTKSSPHRCNNYIIFQSTYWHTLAEENLYDYNPDGVETYHLSPALQISLKSSIISPATTNTASL